MMTEPETRIAQCRAAAVKCCGKLPEFEYTPGLHTIRCPGKCEFTESLPDWCPGHLLARWNARVMGPEKFQKAGHPGAGMVEWPLTEQVKIECERNGLFNDTD